MVMEDNESCGSRAYDSLSPARSRQQRQKFEVYHEVLRRLKDSDNEEAIQPGFDDELWAHFNRLPTRYLYPTVSFPTLSYICFFSLFSLVFFCIFCDRGLRFSLIRRLLGN